MAVPTRTEVLPCLIAVSISEDIPIDNSREDTSTPAYIKTLSHHKFRIDLQLLRISSWHQQEHQNQDWVSAWKIMDDKRMNMEYLIAILYRSDSHESI